MPQRASWSTGVHRKSSLFTVGSLDRSHPVQIQFTAQLQLQMNPTYQGSHETQSTRFFSPWWLTQTEVKYIISNSDKTRRFLANSRFCSRQARSDRRHGGRRTAWLAADLWADGSVSAAYRDAKVSVRASCGATRACRKVKGGGQRQSAKGSRVRRGEQVFSYCWSKVRQTRRWPTCQRINVHFTYEHCEENVSDYKSVFHQNPDMKISHFYKWIVSHLTWKQHGTFLQTTDILNLYYFLMFCPFHRTPEVSLAYVRNLTTVY